MIDHDVDVVGRVKGIHTRQQEKDMMKVVTCLCRKYYSFHNTSKRCVAMVEATARLLRTFDDVHYSNRRRSPNVVCASRIDPFGHTKQAHLKIENRH